MDETGLLAEIARLREQVERAVTQINRLSALLREGGSPVEQVERRPDPLVERLERRVEEAVD
jgi:hypothetical protein